MNQLYSSTNLTQPVVLELPEILNIPPKLLPVLTQFNDFMYFMLDGGRGSAKSHTVARILLYIGEQKKLRIVCGREIEANIEESVYTLLKDLIEEYNLAYDVFAYKIVHRVSKTVFKFKGFRSEGGKGNVKVKGIEGADILWIDEAQSITKDVLDVIIPTIIRKQKCKMIFTMNRFMRDDAVYEHCVGRKDCLHISINYFENPHCSLAMKNEAEIQKHKSLRDYNHIWLGIPLATADDFLFNFEKLYQAYDIKPFGEVYKRQRVLGIDFAAQGNDQCVATVLDRMSNQHWTLSERIPWDEPDTMISVGKIVALIGKYKPDVTVLDIGGMGKPVYDRLIEVGMDIQPFDGGSTEGVDTDHYGNIRSDSYHKLVEWFDNGWLCIDKSKDSEVIKQLEKIKRVYRSDGVRFIEPKQKMKQKVGYSPDDADSLNMAVWGTKFLGQANSTAASGGNITRKSGSKRAR